jgi:hypothetical protein
MSASGGAAFGGQRGRDQEVLRKVAPARQRQRIGRRPARRGARAAAPQADAVGHHAQHHQGGPVLQRRVLPSALRWRGQLEHRRQQLRQRQRRCAGEPPSARQLRGVGAQSLVLLLGQQRGHHARVHRGPRHRPGPALRAQAHLLHGHRRQRAPGRPAVAGRGGCRGPFHQRTGRGSRPSVTESSTGSAAGLAGLQLEVEPGRSGGLSGRRRLPRSCSRSATAPAASGWGAARGGMVEQQLGLVLGQPQRAHHARDGAARVVHARQLQRTFHILGASVSVAAPAWPPAARPPGATSSSAVTGRPSGNSSEPAQAAATVAGMGGRPSSADRRSSAWPSRAQPCCAASVRPSARVVLRAGVLTALSSSWPSVCSTVFRLCASRRSAGGRRGQRRVAGACGRGRTAAGSCRGRRRTAPGPRRSSGRPRRCRCRGHRGGRGRWPARLASARCRHCSSWASDAGLAMTSSTPSVSSRARVSADSPALNTATRAPARRAGSAASACSTCWPLPSGSIRSVNSSRNGPCVRSWCQASATVGGLVHQVTGSSSSASSTKRRIDASSSISSTRAAAHGRSGRPGACVRSAASRCAGQFGHQAVLWMTGSPASAKA